MTFKGTNSTSFSFVKKNVNIYISSGLDFIYLKFGSKLMDLRLYSYDVDLTRRQDR